MKEFKHVQLPDNHNFTDDELQFLKVIDGAFAKTGDRHAEVKEQLREAFIEIEKVRHEKPSGIGERSFSQKERELNNKWIRNFLNKKDTSLIEKELSGYQEKDFSDYLDTGDTSTGGALVPELLLNEIQHVVEEAGIARREMRYMPFSGPGNSRKIPTEASGVSAEWIAEGEPKPISNVTLQQVSQELKKLAAISVITEELAQDSSTDLVGYLSARIGEEIAKSEDDQFFAGVGSPFTGILNDTDIVPVALDPTKTMADLSPDDLLQMIYALPAKYRRGAKFYMPSDAMLKLLQYRSSSVASGDDEGQYLVVTPMQGQPAKLWGFPVVICDALPDISSAVDPDEPFMLFGNLQKTCVYGDKSGLQIKILDQATVEDSEGNTFNLAQVDALGVRVHKRVGYAITLPEGIAVLQNGASS